MLSTPQWITFIVSIVFLISGGVIMAHAAFVTFQKHTKGGVGVIDMVSIIKFIGKMFDGIRESLEARIGLVLFICGVVLMVLTFVLVPGPIVPSPVS